MRHAKLIRNLFKKSLEIIEETSSFKQPELQQNFPRTSTAFNEMYSVSHGRAALCRNPFSPTPLVEIVGGNQPSGNKADPTMELTGDDLVEFTEGQPGRCAKPHQHKKYSPEAEPVTMGLETNDIEIFQSQFISARSPFSNVEYDEDGWPLTGANLSPLPGVSAYSPKRSWGRSENTQDFNPLFGNVKTSAAASKTPTTPRLVRPNDVPLFKMPPAPRQVRGSTIVLNNRKHDLLVIAKKCALLMLFIGCLLAMASLSYRIYNAPPPKNESSAASQQSAKLPTPALEKTTPKVPLDKTKRDRIARRR